MEWYTNVLKSVLLHRPVSTLYLNKIQKICQSCHSCVRPLLSNEGQQLYTVIKKFFSQLLGAADCATSVTTLLNNHTRKQLLVYTSLTSINLTERGWSSSWQSCRQPRQLDRNAGFWQWQLVTSRSLSRLMTGDSRNELVCSIQFHL